MGMVMETEIVDWEWIPGRYFGTSQLGVGGSVLVECLLCSVKKTVNNINYSNNS